MVMGCGKGSHQPVTNRITFATRRAGEQTSVSHIRTFSKILQPRNYQ